MKNVVWIDIKYTSGHRALNIRYIRIMSQYARIYVINDGQYYNALNNTENVVLINHEMVSVRRSKLKYRLDCLKNMKICSSAVNAIEDPYIVIFAAYEITTFWAWHFFCKKKIQTYLFEHNSIDETQGIIKKSIYASYKNHVKHIVLEELFQVYMTTSLKVREENIVVIHYLPEKMCLLNSSTEKKEYRIVSLSRSTPEPIIERLICWEKIEHKIVDSGNTILLRSRLYEFQDDGMRVLKGDIDSKLYNKWLLEADAILILNTNFRNRVVSSIFDAIGVKKHIIAPNIPIVQYLKTIAPKSISVYKNFDELKNILTRQHFTISVEEIAMLQQRYSDEAISNEIKKILSV